MIVIVAVGNDVMLLVEPQRLDECNNNVTEEEEEEEEEVVELQDTPGSKSSSSSSSPAPSMCSSPLCISSSSSTVSSDAVSPHAHRGTRTQRDTHTYQTCKRRAFWRESLFYHTFWGPVWFVQIRRVFLGGGASIGACVQVSIFRNLTD